MRDTPFMDEVVADCLRQHTGDPAACDRPRAAAVVASDPQVLAAHAMRGVDVLDLVDSFCAATVCPAVAGNVPVYVDDSHMTPSFCRTLPPALQRQLVALGVVDDQPSGPHVACSSGDLLGDRQGHVLLAQVCVEDQGRC